MGHIGAAVEQKFRHLVSRFLPYISLDTIPDTGHVTPGDPSDPPRDKKRKRHRGGEKGGSGAGLGVSGVTGEDRVATPASGFFDDEDSMSSASISVTSEKPPSDEKSPDEKPVDEKSPDAEKTDNAENSNETPVENDQEKSSPDTGNHPNGTVGEDGLEDDKESDMDVDIEDADADTKKAYEDETDVEDANRTVTEESQDDDSA
jgi:hypothetical protein